jgi:hypothetical protein
MAERPILFSDALVRAILDGRKTVTRRPVAKSNGDLSSGSWSMFDHATAKKGKTLFAGQDCLYVPGGNDEHHRLYPRYDVGDRLWVREAWTGLSLGDYEEITGPPSRFPQYVEWRYRASDPLASLDRDTREYGYPPSIHMPRRASRITLEVTDVRVERVQDITEEQARAEGMPEHPDALNWRCRNSFMDTWDTIYAGRTDKPGLDWASNPWVWVVEFKQVETGEVSRG